MIPAMPPENARQSASRLQRAPGLDAEALFQVIRRDQGNDPELCRGGSFRKTTILEIIGRLPISLDFMLPDGLGRRPLVLRATC